MQNEAFADAPEDVVVALVEAGETPAPAPSAPLTIRATDHALPESDTDGAYLYEATILVNHLM